MPYKEGKAEGEATVSSNYQSLLALYRLNEGPESPEVSRRHYELFKVQRSRPAAVPPLKKMELELVAAPDLSGIDGLPSVSESELAEFKKLVQQLM